jgi:hypothetical protein
MNPWRALLILLIVFAATPAWAGPVLIYSGTGRQVGKSDASPHLPILTASRS